MDNLSLHKNHQPYAPAAATDVQSTCQKPGWLKPSKDPETLAKWDYYKSLAMRSEAALQFTKE